MYTNGAIKTPGKSLTEPSTPQRSISKVNDSSGTYSLPHNRFQATTELRLPPNELPTITVKLSEQARAGIGSSRNGPPKSKTSSTSYDSPPLSRMTTTPTRRSQSRRASALFGDVKTRRRRSSIMKNANGEEIYDPNYVGPITVNYLRFLCKVAFQEKQIKKHQIEIQSPVHLITDNELQVDTLNSLGEQTVAAKRKSSISELPSKRKHSSPIIDQSHAPFDLSLQLPDDTEDLLKSPIYSIKHGSEVQTNNPFLEVDTSDTKFAIDDGVNKSKSSNSKPFSYLEKILYARKLKKVKESTSDKKKSDEHIDSHQGTLDNSYNTRLDAFDKENNSSLHYGAVRANYTHQDQEDFGNDFVEKEKISVQLESLDSPNREEGISSQFKIETEENYEELGFDDYKVDIANESPIQGELTPDIQPENIKYSPSKIVTPQVPLGIYNDEIQSPTGLIQEEYTLDNNNEVDTFLLQDSYETNIEDFKKSEIFDQTGSTMKIKPLRRILAKSHSSSVSNSIPMATIKKLIKSIQFMNLHRDDSRINGGITSLRTKNYSPENYKFIQEKSEDFLENMVADVEAYALHRTSGKGGQINIKDVILLLNRISYTGNRSENNIGIKNIAKLAQQFLPLELLISLDNNLSQLQVPYSVGRSSHTNVISDTDAEEFSPETRYSNSSSDSDIDYTE